MKRIAVLFAFAVLAPVFSGGAGEKKEDLPDMEKVLLDLTNAERKKEGLKPVRWNPVLAKVARAHAENMAQQKKEVHVLDGKSPSDRVKAAGYRYSRTGENVGSMTPGFELEDLMKAWMESKGHRKNILQEDFEEAGMGAARNEDGRLYFAQIFATPPKKGP